MHLRCVTIIPGDADLLLWVVPTQHLRSSLLRLQPADGAIVVCAKGVEAETHLLPLEVVSDVSPCPPLAILTGPNFAHEVAKGLPAAAVVASTDAGLREQVRAMLGTSHISPCMATMTRSAPSLVAPRRTSSRSPRARSSVRGWVKTLVRRW